MDRLLSYALDGHVGAGGLGLAGFDRDVQRLGADSARLFVSDEAREAMLAFLHKRPPRWAAPGHEGGAV